MRARAFPILSLLLLGLLSCLGPAASPEPVVYTLRFPDPSSQVTEIQVTFPTGGSPDLVLMMPVWSPGFYRVQDLAGKVLSLAARGSGGEDLPVQKTAPNRWRIDSRGVAKVEVTYRLHCPDSFVTTNWVSPELLVLNGPATFITALGAMGRPQEIYLEPPPTWAGVATGLAEAGDMNPHHFQAGDYDTLVDSPIVAGDLTVTSFEVAGVPHHLVDVGEREGWVEASLPLWGALPYSKYVFLNVFRRGRGGLEHGNSTLLTTGAGTMASPRAYHGWLNFAAHEYFHAFNVKRLRPVELGPFDYEAPPSTPSLWHAEGLTSYYAGLLVVRAGLWTTEDFLASLSAQIASLQNSPGRLLQSMEESSLNVWSNSNSGIGAAPTTVSYYVKGEVVGFLLDARIQVLTGGEASLQDVMRLAYLRYGRDRGFEPEEFRSVAEEVAGQGMAEWFHTVLATTEELDYLQQHGGF